MKNHLIKITAIILVAVMALVPLAGCKKTPEGLFVPPEFVFVAEAIRLPNDLGRDIGFVQLFGDKLIFAVSKRTEPTAENNFTSTYISRIYTADIDGSNITEISGYKPSGADSTGTGIVRNAYISNMQCDANGNIWVIEQWSSGQFILPSDFNPEVTQIWEYEYEDLGSGTVLRKLDSNGAEISQLDVQRAFGQREWLYIYAFNFDSEGNGYFALENSDYNVGGMEIYVLDENFNNKFVLTSDRWFDSFIRLPDGRVGFPSYRYDQTANRDIREIQTIDVAAEDFGGTIEIPLPPNVDGNILAGSGIYDIIINNYNSIYGYTFGEEEPVKLLTWLETDVAEGDVQNVTMISEDRIICTNWVYDRVDFTNSTTELLILTRIPYSELPERTVLTLATFDAYSVRSAVVQFNRTNPEYRIHVIDYSQYGTPEDPFAGVMRLSTELISGRVPDILCVSPWGMNYKEYVAKDLLADLYQFIDSDPVYSRDSFVDGVFSAVEIGGSLYQVFPSFSINTLIGHPAVVGPEMGWNMEEFTAVLEANPQADMPLGQGMTKTVFLEAAVSFAIDDYIDWSSGRVYFDTPQFISLLEFCNNFPEDIDYENIDWDTVEWVDQEEAIATGRQIMLQTSIWGFESTLWPRQQFGGDIAFKGFPNETRNGNSLSVNFGLAIIDISPNKDGAWSFVRMILDEDWQRQNSWGLYTNKAAFETGAAEALQQDYSWYGMTRVVAADGEITYEQSNDIRLTQENIDEILAIIASSAGTASWSLDETIGNIIREESNDYFSGLVTAEVAARGIQSKVSILVSERS